MMKRRRGRENGDIVEAVLVAPVLLLVIFLIVQFALMYHSRSVAETAAQEAVAAARVHGGTIEDGQSAAEAVLKSSGKGVLQEPRIEVTTDGQTVTAVVAGKGLSIVEGIFQPSISRTVASPVERYVPPESGQQR